MSYSVHRFSLEIPKGLLRDQVQEWGCRKAPVTPIAVSAFSSLSFRKWVSDRDPCCFSTSGQSTLVFFSYSLSRDLKWCGRLCQIQEWACKRLSLTNKGL